ncbi:uncharacterized protein VTP21DRAFT_2257 [Calcarisporiella thermophila]|uniref:uncharacterized protein n=1 Tax=Calcarisporiella thermophila TaxID=911321 RepID=UPI0037434E2C
MVDQAALAVAALTAAGMYADSKLFLSSDLRQLRGLIIGAYLIAKCRREDTFNFCNRFLEQVKATPDRVYLLYQDKTYTFKDIDQQSNQLGHFLLSKGIKRGDIVAIYMQNKPEFIISWLAINKIGASAAFINYNLNDKPLLHSLSTCSPRILLIDPEIPQNIAENLAPITEELKIEIISYGEDQLPFCRALTSHELSQYPTSSTPRKLRLGALHDATMVLIYTSGTTGLPKPAILQPGRITLAAGMWKTLFNIRKEDRMYCCLPLYHGAAAILLVFQSWITGASVALSQKFSATNFWHEIIKYDCNIFQYIGEICRYLLNTPPNPSVEKGHRIRLAMGNGMRPDIWEKFRERFNIPVIGEYFAATEGITSLFNVNTGPLGAGAVGHRGTIARLVETGLQLIKIDPVTEEPLRDHRGFCIPAGVNEPGELIQQIVPDHPFRNFRGYHKNPEATKKKILQNVFKKGDSYFRFNDLLRRDENGYYWFCDRLGDTFRWKSENVSTMEVADVLAGFPSIEEANVYGVEVPGHDGRCGMSVIKVRGEKIDFKELAIYLKKKLPGYAIPQFIRPVSSIELTGTFKQRKVEYRNEGINVNKVKDPLYWLRGDEYIPFKRDDYEAILRGSVRL